MISNTRNPDVGIARGSSFAVEPWDKRFAGDPYQYIHNWVFWCKMLFIFLAGLNVLLFYLTGVIRNVEGLQPGDDAPVQAKIIAAVSLFLWIGVIYLGRMLPFFGDAF